jgi:hypothetical protein
MSPYLLRRRRGNSGALDKLRSERRYAPRRLSRGVVCSAAALCVLLAACGSAKPYALRQPLSTAQLALLAGGPAGGLPAKAQQLIAAAMGRIVSSCMKSRGFVWTDPAVDAASPPPLGDPRANDALIAIAQPSLSRASVLAFRRRNGYGFAAIASGVSDRGGSGMSADVLYYDKLSAAQRQRYVNALYGSAETRQIHAVAGTVYAIVGSNNGCANIASARFFGSVEWYDDLVYVPETVKAHLLEEVSVSDAIGDASRRWQACMSREVGGPVYASPQAAHDALLRLTLRSSASVARRRARTGERATAVGDAQCAYSTGWFSSYDSVYRQDGARLPLAVYDALRRLVDVQRMAASRAAVYGVAANRRR